MMIERQVFSPSHVNCYLQLHWDEGGGGSDRLSYLSSPSSAVWWCLRISSWCPLWPAYTLHKTRREWGSVGECVSCADLCGIVSVNYQTFCVVFVQLTGHFLPLLHLHLQRSDETFRESSERKDDTQLVHIKQLTCIHARKHNSICTRRSSLWGNISASTAEMWSCERGCDVHELNPPPILKWTVETFESQWKR